MDRKPAELGTQFVEGGSPKWSSMSICLRPGLKEQPTDTILGVPSPFFPGILLSREPSETDSTALIRKSMFCFLQIGGVSVYVSFIYL